jgi:hypothetical protein
MHTNESAVAALSGPPPIAEPAAAALNEPPTLGEVLTAGAGLAALGACAGLGAGAFDVALRAVPAGLVVAAGAVILTGPALVVAHQYRGMAAPPEALVGALSRGFTACGRVALGLSPALLFFSATSGLWAACYCLFMAAAGSAGGVVAARELLRAEAASGQGPGIAGLTLSWSALAALIALRIGWGMAGFVAGQGGVL